MPRWINQKAVEQTVNGAVEYGRRVQLALAYLEELDCGCEPDEFSSVKEAPCGRCDLEGILNGDVA